MIPLDVVSPVRVVSRRLWLRLTLLGLLVTLLGVAASTFLLTRQAQGTLQEVAREAELSVQLRQLQGLLVGLVDAETGQRGYLLSNDETDLAPYTDVVERLPALLKALDDNARIEDPSFQATASRTKAAVAQKLAELGEAIRLQRLGDRDAAMGLFMSDAARRSMQQVRAQVDASVDIVRTERDRLDDQIASGESRIKQLLLWAVALLILLAGLVAVQMRSLLEARAESERALTQSERRHRAIVEEQGELISLARTDGTLLYVNPAYVRHFGRTSAQVLGATLYDFVDPADRATVRQLIDTVLRTGEPLQSENRMTDVGGVERWVAWMNRRHHDANGAPLLHSVGRDITLQKQAERALRSSQDFLARTGRLAGIGGWEHDLVTGQATWSPEVRRIMEVDDDHVPTLELSMQSYLPGSRHRIERALRNCVDLGIPWDLELKRVTATGREIWVRVIGDAEFDDTRCIRIVGAMQDITERKVLEQRFADNERFLRQITDHVPMRIAYLDREMRYRFVNQAHCTRFGKERADILGRTRSELTGGISDAYVRPFIEGVLAGQPQRYELDEDRDGERRRIEVQLVPDSARDGEVAGFYTTSMDITERVATERALRDQTATLRSVTEAIPAIVAVVGADGRYRFVNSACERWLGMPRDLIIGQHLQRVLGAEEHERSRLWVERALGGETFSVERSYPERSCGKHLGFHYIPLWNGDVVEGFVSVAQDITQHKEEEGRLIQLTQRDALTGLLNRSGFEAHLKRKIDDGDGDTLALLYIDLDHFKPVNDRHGHPAGDAVLRQFGERLLNLVRPTDAVARLGGDEFAVALSGVREHANAAGVADKIVAAARLPFTFGALNLQIGASVGVAFQADPETGWPGLVERADVMLYKAKSAGRGQRA